MSLPEGCRYISVISTFEELAEAGELSLAHELSVYPPKLVPCIPREYRMRKGQKKCTSCALFAYNGIGNCSKVLNIGALMQLMKTTKQKPVNMFSKLPSLHSAMFINAEDRLTPCLVFFEDIDAPCQLKSQQSDWFSSKCIVVLYHPVFYPDGHCIVVYPPHEDLPGVWCILDSFRKDGSNVAITRDHLALLFAYADIILW